MKPSRFVRMFKPQFAPLVRDSIKLQTVRQMPKRMPVPGDIIDCREWSGKPYRSQQVRLKESEIVRVDRVEIYPLGMSINGMSYFARHEFAVSDGFDTYYDMLHWFEETHGLPFTGIVIAWKP